jgi:hypothetical protein
VNNFARRHVEAGGAGGVHSCYTHIAFHPGIVIAVWDGPGAKKRRTDIFPGYKKHRQLPSDNIQAGMKLVYECLKHGNVLQIKVPGYEADDVIAQLALTYGHIPIHIHSTDQDFAQLLHHSTITFEGQNNLKCEAKDTRLFKACVGDVSDKIPGIKGMGKMAWLGLSIKCKAKLQLIAEGSEADLSDTYVPKSCQTWLNTQEGVKLFRDYWKIVGFFDVPASLITEHSFQGEADVAKVNEIMKKYFMAPVKMDLSLLKIPRGLYDSHIDTGGSPQLDTP